MGYERQILLALNIAVLIGWSGVNNEVNHYNSQRSNGWTEWSKWSDCSRTCDGGVSFQRRECTSEPCHGESIRYKICNMQDCPDNADYRDAQCVEFNSVPYEGYTSISWKSYYHPDQLCALFCVNQDNIIDMLASKVKDGTRCRPGSLDMCIDGECKAVGCDLEIGSSKATDECGVCGGDGKSCSDSLYQWNEKVNTSCSKKCGGGYKVTQPVCQNTRTGLIVDQSLCDIGQMPQSRVMECHVEPCPPQWEAGEWSACSQSCGSGIRTRKVYCVEEQNKTKITVFNYMCKGHKPQTQKSCNMQPCPPEWVAGPWTPCSASCGQGIQTRNVTCKTAQELMKCDSSKKLTTEQKCISSFCKEDRYMSYETDNSRFSSIAFRDSPFLPDKFIAKQNISPHAVFVSEEWGPCSATCGEGFRRRKVYCKAHLDYMKITTKFEDDTCTGEKPADTEPCFEKDCEFRSDPPMQDYLNTDDSLTPKVAPGTYGKTYSWKKNGFTPCSATCLGGVQELIVNCVRDEDQKVVSPYLCSRTTQPEVVTQTCNDHPCPPRWNVSEYQACSKKCGMGIETREVNCIHEVTISNTVLVPAHMCEQPQPTDRQYCNFIDCPVEWHIGNWTKCSKACGGGEKKREVQCRQITAQNHIVPKPEHLCPAPKPATSRPCNSKPCSNQSKQPTIVFDDEQDYNQEKDARNLDVSLKIGGKAAIFFGTTVIIKCPVKKFNKAKIKWLKDGQQLSNSEKYRINRKGKLKISDITYDDSAVFSCSAGQSTGNIRITVKARPNEFPPSSEEIEKRPSALDPETMKYSGNYGIIEHSESDISHERIPANERSSKSHASYKQNVGTSTERSQSNSKASTEKNQESKQPEVADSILPPTSAASRSMPSFFNFFTNIKSSHRRQRNDRSPIDDSELQNEEGLVLQSSTEIDSRTTTAATEGVTNGTKYEWLISDWSNCSPACGGPGFQVRSAHCMAKQENATHHVNSSFCLNIGLASPLTIQECETEECPQWVTSEWQSCQEARCFAWNTAMQRRDVYCKAPNGTVIEDKFCEESEKPTNKQECYNDICKGTWKVGEWSQCMVECEKEGLKYRILQCVWYGTKKPAGTACRDQPRPPVMRPCKGAPCNDSAVCKDRSKYCQNVKSLNMCKSGRYKLQCCQTCKSE